MPNGSELQDDESPVAFSSIGDFMRMLEIYRYVVKLRASSPIIQSQPNQIPPGTEVTLATFRVTGSPDKHDWYTASNGNRYTQALTEGDEWFDLGENFLIQGLNKEALMVDKWYDGIVCDHTVGVETSADLDERVANDEGFFTIGDGHGITVGDIIDVYWTDTGVKKKRTGMVVTEIGEDGILLEGGTGDNLPAAATSVKLYANSSGTNRLPAAIVIAPTIKERVKATSDTADANGHFSGKVTPWQHSSLSYITGVDILLKLAEGVIPLVNRYYSGKLIDWVNDTMLFEIWGNDKHVAESCDEDGDPIYDLWLIPAPFGIVLNTDSSGNPL